MKKRKLRKPRNLWDIAECRVHDNGHYWIVVDTKSYPAWLSARSADKLAKWFADAAAWVKQQEGE